ncbi:MAG: hypothetical protein AAGK21_05470, partial [Bacteroidota bacterium]
PLADVPLADVPLADVPLADVPLADVPLADVPLADVPLADVPLADVPLADGYSVIVAGASGTRADCPRSPSCPKNLRRPLGSQIQTSSAPFAR